jgi:hypothetical protein
MSNTPEQTTLTEGGVMETIIGKELIYPFRGIITEVVERDGFGGHFLLVEHERAGTCWVDVFDGYEISR